MCRAFRRLKKKRRWDGVRKKMKMSNLDALVFLGNDTFFDMGLVKVRYLTHIGSKAGTNALFFLDEDPIVWNALPHQQRPTDVHHHTQNWTSDIRPFLGLGELISEFAEPGYRQGRRRADRVFVLFRHNANPAAQGCGHPGGSLAEPGICSRRADDGGNAPDQKRGRTRRDDRNQPYFMLGGG